MRWTIYEAQIVQGFTRRIIEDGMSIYEATTKCYETMQKSGYNRSYEAVRRKIYVTRRNWE